MSESVVRDREKIVAALACIEGHYCTNPATRNMLMIVVALIVPLLVLMLVRLLGNLIPQSAAIAIGALFFLIAFGALLDLAFGAASLTSAGIARYSPLHWLRWQVSIDELAGLGVLKTSRGRYLVVEASSGKIYRLPFRHGFERVGKFLA